MKLKFRNLLRSAILLSFTAISLAPMYAASPKRGAQLFAYNGCDQCHSIHGVGGDKGPDLSGVGLRLKKKQIHSQIVKGGRQMPAFGDVLRKSEVSDLVAYLQSCKDKPTKQTVAAK
jgi:ubiquinol-cytochrome c reductase cytochrome b subunit